MQNKSKIVMSSLMAALMLSIAEPSFAGCSNFGGYVRGNSPVVGGFATQVYSSAGMYQYGDFGQMCNPTAGSVTGSGNLYGLACTTPVSIGVCPCAWCQVSYTTVNTGSCPSNTATIKVSDYRRADGISVPGESFVCVATDTYQ